MALDTALERALRSPDPVNELRSFVNRLFSQGQDKEAVLGLFEKARQELRRANREADEDAVTDVMDFLLGWCSPHVKLSPPEKLDRNNNGAVQGSGQGGAAETPSEQISGSSPQSKNTQ